MWKQTNFFILYFISFENLCRNLSSYLEEQQGHQAQLPALDEDIIFKDPEDTEENVEDFTDPPFEFKSQGQLPFTMMKVTSLDKFFT